VGPGISAESIVTFYDGKDSKYISQQRHTMYPADSVIMIEANEPEGDFGWTLADGVFTSQACGDSSIPAGMCTGEIARAILLSVSARAGFLNEKNGLMLKPISIAGQIYQPIVMNSSDDGPVTEKVYREVSSYKMDWVEIGNSEEKVLIAARSYDLRDIPDSDKLMPTSIDIYNTDSSGRPSDRIMKIEYQTYGFISKQ